MSTSFEEAKACPKCGLTGTEGKATKRPGGGKNVPITCMNERCRWYDTSWVITIRPDGTIPDATTDRVKQFPALPTAGVEQYLQNVKNSIEVR